MRNLRLFVCVLSVVAALNAPASANDNNKSTYQVSGAQVVVVCPLTVGGRFEAKTQAVTGEVSLGGEQPTALKGALSVDLRTLKTGIGMRDRHMRANYLEVDKGPGFEQATIEDIQIEKLDGKTTFRGTLVLHGERRPVTGSAIVQPRDGGYSVQAEFPVRVSEFNIPKPTYLGVGVQDEIRVKIALSVVSTTTTARAKSR